MIFSTLNWKALAARAKNIGDGSAAVKDSKNGNWTVTKAKNIITFKKGADVRTFTVEYFINCKFPAIEKEIGEPLTTATG